MKTVRCVLWIAVTALAHVSAPVPEARAETPSEAPAAPSPFASMVAELDTKEATAPQLRKDAEADRANPALEAERRLYEQQIQTRLIPIKDAIVADFGKLKADIDKHNQGVARSDAGCTGQLPQPQYERCQGEKRHWDANKGRLDERKGALEQRIAAYEKQTRPYAKRLAEIAAQIERNKQTSAQARRALAETEARIRELKARIADACKALPPDAPPEHVKYCGDRGWSGARRGLPELKRPRPPFEATPNR